MRSRIRTFAAFGVFLPLLAGVAFPPPAALAEDPPQFLLRWGSSGPADGQFSLPGGIAVDALGIVFVADTENHRVQMFTDMGAFLGKWGTSGAGNGQLTFPQALAHGLSGDVYVVDLSDRVQRFTRDGAFLAAWGGFGTSNGRFRTPQGVAVGPGGGVYVVDRGNHRIQKFTADGLFVSAWGGLGAGNGSFRNPRGVAVDALGNVYVADTDNRRIQKFTADGAFLLAWGALGTGNGQFLSPWSLAIDRDGNVWVADAGLPPRVQKFSGDGAFLCGFGSWGVGDGQFWSPRGIAIDARKHLFVADRLRQDVQKFGGETLLAVVFDIHPASCPNSLNPRSRGVVPAAILGSADVDASAIDPASIRLEGAISPLRWQVEDLAAPPEGTDACACGGEGPDGFDDLALKFSTEEIAAVLGDAAAGDVRELTVSGALHDGTRFEGKECVVIRGQKSSGADPRETGPSGDGPGLVVESGPSEPTQAVSYGLAVPATVTLSVFDVSGRRVLEILRADEPAGRQVHAWDASGLRNGIYFYVLRRGAEIESKKFLLLR